MLNYSLNKIKIEVFLNLKIKKYLDIRKEIITYKELCRYFTTFKGSSQSIMVAT